MTAMGEAITKVPFGEYQNLGDHASLWQPVLDDHLRPPSRVAWRITACSILHLALWPSSHVTSETEQPSPGALEPKRKLDSKCSPPQHVHRIPSHGPVPFNAPFGFCCLASSTHHPSAMMAELDGIPKPTGRSLLEAIEVDDAVLKSKYVPSNAGGTGAASARC